MEGHLVAETVKPARRRTVEDRFAIHMPWLYRPLMRVVGRLFERLRPGSRIRDALIKNGVARSYGAWNRLDADALVAMYHTDVLWRHYPGGFGAGWPGDGDYRGHEGIRRVVGEWAEAFDVYRGDATDVRDFGDHLRITVKAMSRGRTSGIETEMTWSQVSAQREGLVWFVGQGAERFEPPE